MKMTIKQLDEMVTLLTLFKTDELVLRLDKDGSIKEAIEKVENLAIDIIV